MARKKTALLMTVGTGIGSTQEIVDNLAHGLLSSIDSNNPDLIIFFGSENSKPTIESMKKQHLERFDEELDFYEFIQIEDIDSFSQYFQAIKNKVLELQDEYKILIDYTSGTKTMTMSAAFVSMLFRKKLVFVSGKRDKGTVIKGTEKVVSQNLYLLYDEMMINKTKELFNSNRFEAATDIIEDIVDEEEKDVFLKLISAYSNFDNVNYEKANEFFDVQTFKEKWDELSNDLILNKKALSIMNTENHGLRCYYILASLLNNARRRGEENKYDDAIARLYRSLELIGQIKLKKDYGIITSDVDIEILKENNVREEYVTNLENRNHDKIKTGLVQDYKLLYELNDNLGIYFYNKEKVIQDVLKFRNYSILAHGLESKTKEEYERFEAVVLNMANKLHENMEQFIEETKFPEFSI